MTATATPTKLRNGEWGCRAPMAVAEGDVVTIETRSGKSWSARIQKVLWRGDDVAICATSSLDRAPSAPRRDEYAQSYCWYPCPVSGRKCCPANGPCHDCE